MIVATAALEEGATTENEYINDRGVYPYGHNPVCWYYTSYHRGHGNVNIKTALQKSCNYFFYEMGRRLGADKIAEYARYYGLGTKTGVELTGEATGTIACSEEAQKQGEQWYPSYDLSAAIGQIYNRYSPIQMARYVSILANGGNYVTPTLIKEVRDSDGNRIPKEEIRNYTNELLGVSTEQNSDLKISDKTLDTVKAGMRLVTSSGGTAYAAFKNFDKSVAGKTGSAQAKSKENLLKLAKKEFNNNEISDQIFNSYIEGLSTKTLIQVTSPVLKKGIILICFYNNFENITEVWMQHYINIGIKNFVLVDKNSQDKSTEILKKYSKNVNISFWKINENFNDSNQSGLQQKIVEFYGADNFYLFVEPYELLIYKNFEKINIDKYIQKMKVSIFKSLVLDVYPNKNIKNPSFRDFKYIDNNTYKITSQRYGQKFYGGPYLRVLKTNLCLQKISLIKYTGKEIFINKHFYYPFSLNNKAKFCTYLLNYNLLKETNKKERIIFYDKKTSKLLSDLI